MARWLALLPLGALLAFAVNGAAAGCLYGEWACGSGDQCIDGWKRCSGGESYCTDGSDNDAAMCGKAPSIRLREGQVTTVRAEFKPEYSGVEFHLCGPASCSSIVLHGRTADGTQLAYWAWTECNLRGRICGEHKKHIPDAPNTFPAGPVVFKVERRPNKLAVWLDGHEDQVVTVPTREDSDLLRVRPLYWTSDLAVRFSGGFRTRH